MIFSENRSPLFGIIAAPRSARDAPPPPRGRPAPRSSRELHAPPVQGFRREPCGGKRALVALGDRDGEVLRPPPPEIHIDGAAALPHRQHLAFDQRELATIFED